MAAPAYLVGAMMRSQESSVKVEGPSEFSEAQHAFGHGHGTVLSAFAERMATLAAREGSLQALRDGMSAEQWALAVLGDVRDSLPVLSLLFRALGYPGTVSCRKVQTGGGSGLYTGQPTPYGNAAGHRRRRCSSIPLDPSGSMSHTGA